MINHHCWQFFNTVRDCLIFFWICLGSFGMCLGVAISPQKHFLPKVFWKSVWSKRCLGGSRRVHGVPQTLLKIIYLSGKSYIVQHMFFNCLLPCLLYCLLNCLLSRFGCSFRTALTGDASTQTTQNRKQNRKQNRTRRWTLHLNALTAYDVG